MQVNQDVRKLTCTATSRKAVIDHKNAIETQKQIHSAKGENKDGQADEKLTKSTGSGWPGSLPRLGQYVARARPRRANSPPRATARRKLEEYEEVWAGDYIFENEWQSFRTKKDRSLELKSVFHECAPGGRKLAVKVVDIFGNDTMTIVEVRP